MGHTENLLLVYWLLLVIIITARDWLFAIQIDLQCWVRSWLHQGHNAVRVLLRRRMALATACWKLGSIQNGWIGVIHDL